ncbi:MAG: ABC transporter permease [Deltaproteobacteria bacterium]|nr:ABC transporter permease [Deltaproteobacteria bacterium]
MTGPLLAPHDPFVSSLEEALQAPGAGHFLGTDANGRDILSLILYSARISLAVSFCVVLCCLFLGTTLGFIAGFFGGPLDRLFLFTADVFQAFPGILLAITVAAFIPQSLINMILLLSFVGWVSYARLIRAGVLSLKSRDYILAATVLGLPKSRILWRHVFPNLAGPVIVQASFGMAGVILAESALSFLGLGLPAGTPSLGKLMDQGVNLLLVAPYVSIFPGAVIMFFVLSFNFVGDSLREKFDV